MSQKQKTLNAAISFSGKGLHTGVEVKMNILPSAENSGIRFKRVDLEGAPEVEAVADYVVDTSRGTTIEKNKARVSTIEHIMAALWTSGVDNALIEIDAPETPIMDGSAKEYIEQIIKTGLKEQDADIEYYEIGEKTLFAIPEKGVEITVYPDTEFMANVNIDFDSKVLGHQYARMRNESDFAQEIAPCRTFVFLHELEPLIKNDLIKGGDLDNAIVIVEKETSPGEIENLKKLFEREDVKVEKGYLNNLELRFSNECARHKLLDLLGDLALVGMRIKGRIVAYKPGHYANTELARIIRKNIKRDAAGPKYAYDPNIVPVYDINQIKNILPHRPPFLLVDKIMHIDNDSVMGIKNVTMNEPFFVGHFPHEPVMPGVLTVEAMAQCGGILALHNLKDPENYSTYFLRIDGVRYRRKIVPGDTIQFELKLAEPIRRGIVIMDAKAYVGNQLATEAQLMAQVAKNK